MRARPGSAASGDRRAGPWPASYDPLAMIVFGAVYAAAVVLGRMSRLPGTSLALVWPAAAAGFIWLLWASYRGRRFLVVNAALLAGLAGLVNYLTGASVGPSVALALANTVQAVVECAVLSRVRPGGWRLRRPADLVGWVLACLLGALAGACVGPAALAAGGGGPFWPLALAWTLRNATNSFVFGAVVLRVAGFGFASLIPPRSQAPEFVAAGAVLLGVYGVVFGFSAGLPLAYLVLPLSMWISLRFSTTVAAGHVLVAAVLVVSMTMIGHGPFAAVSPATRVLLAQTFVAIVGLVALVLALHRDERQELVVDLRAARARADQQAVELRRVSQLKTEFLATMSHEIRTPLNGVLGFTALLAESPHDPAAGEWARAADTAGRSLLGIVNNGLDLAKIEAGGIELEHIGFDLETLCREALLPSELAAREAGLTLRLELADGVARRRVGDPVRLRQVLTNLVANAVKFTEHGSVTLAVDNGVDPALEPPAEGVGDQVRLRVVDTGIGMDDEQRRRLFTPFRQGAADTTRRFGGTGLGLSIAHGLVTAMGGRIQVASVPGRGTTFSVELRLPRSFDVPAARPPDTYPDERTAPPTISTARPPDAAAPDGRSGVRVLVAEDNEINQLVARATLRSRGLEVDVVGNGEEAVTAALSGRYDAVFMDCQMPVLDGLEATRQIRVREVGHIPVIAMTAGAFHEDRQACLAAGMDDFLPKPWKREELAAVLTRLGVEQVPASRPTTV